MIKGITQRDMDIYNFICEQGSLTADQCSKIFMSENKRKYDIACRRLRKLVSIGYIKSGSIKYTHENVYFIDKKLSFHDLMVIQVCAELVNFGAKDLKLKRNKRWYDDLISDGFIYYTLNDKPNLNIIEICFSNKKVKIDMYNELYKTNLIQNEFNIEPKLIIVSNFDEDNYKNDENGIPTFVFNYTFNGLYKMFVEN